VETISSYLASDHKRCDALFEQVEISIDEGKWEQAETSFQCFSQALDRHLAMEENVLFPAFEKATGSSDGPTGIMRREHQHIRAIASRLNDAVSQRNASDFFDHDDTLRILMGQHNLKEETILYFMTDRVLSDKQGVIIGAMAEIVATTTTLD
jgi:hemerythrin-like domain-containing protein